MSTAQLPIDPSVAANPVVYWLIGIVGVGTLVLPSIRRESSAFTAWLAGLRRAAENRDDARVADLVKDVDWLKSKIHELESQMAERDKLARVHLRWDHQAIVALIRADPAAADRLGEPPSLYPER